MVNNEIITFVSNLKLSISSCKINPNAIKRFFISIINNKHVRNILILQFIIRVLAGSIDISSHFSCWEIKNLNTNNENNESEAETRIELENKIN